MEMTTKLSEERNFYNTLQHNWIESTTNGILILYTQNIIIISHKNKP